ncbi:Gigantea-like protein, partial [Thalictrum thalictroides]
VVDALCNVVSASPAKASAAIVLQAEKDLQPWIARDDEQGQRMWKINQRIVKLIVELMRNHDTPESLVILASASDLLLRATDGMLVDGEACTLPQLELLEATAKSVQLVVKWGDSGSAITDGLSNLLKVELFVGGTNKPGTNGFCDGPGTIEVAPHNTLHGWVGKESNRYEKIDNPWLNARPKPTMDPTFARHALNKRHSAQSSDFRPKGRTLDCNITVKVHKPKKQRKTENEVLVVYGIDAKEDVYVKFDVYVNAIDATTIGPELTEFDLPRGRTLVFNKGDTKRKSKSTLKLGISELLK